MNPNEFNHQFKIINGSKYHYVDQGIGSDYILLMHGWPDLWYGWKYQILHLENRFRVICPDMIGYGQTDHPDSKKQDKYSFLSIATDMVELMAQVGATRFHVIAHDWGAVAAWRLAQYRPENDSPWLVFAHHFHLLTQSLCLWIYW